MKFQREEYSANLVAEMRPLISEHNREIPQLGLEADPDLKAYKLMDEAKGLRIYTARIASMLVGYQVFMVGYHPHRRASLEATQDVLYMEPEARQGFLGIKFIKWCDEQLKKEGVRVVHHPIDADHDFGKLLKRMGYEMSDIVYSKKMEVA